MSDTVAGIHHIQLKRNSSLNYITQAGKLGKICRENNIDLLFTLYGGGFALATYLSGFRPYAVGSDALLISSLFRFYQQDNFQCFKPCFANGRYLAEKPVN